MTKEASKSIYSRLRDSRYLSKYFVGDGLDVGCGPDPLNNYIELFPLMKSCRSWDLEDGDGELLEGVSDGVIDFVHSSHSLEHMGNPYRAIFNWLRVLKEGGHLICIIPDEDMYEQGVFPSTFNGDHKNTFTIFKSSSWSYASINIIDLIAFFGDAISLIKVDLLNSTWLPNLAIDDIARIDQTNNGIGECGIEFIIQKRSHLFLSNLSHDRIRQFDFGVIRRNISFGKATMTLLYTDCLGWFINANNCIELPGEKNKFYVLSFISPSRIPVFMSGNVITIDQSCECNSIAFSVVYSDGEESKRVDIREEYSNMKYRFLAEKYFNCDKPITEFRVFWCGIFTFHHVDINLKT